MGKKAGKKNGGSGSAAGGGGFSTLDVDPRHVRYAHSKIKPHFSGCGRTIEQTLGEIRDGKTRPSDLPMITILLGPSDPAGDGGQQQQQCFFSLNNRRLFVFKACREENLLGPSGLVRVRARAMKAHERERYTVERCSLQAKFLFAPKPATAGPTRQDPDDDVPVVRLHPLPERTPSTTAEGVQATTAEGVQATRRSSSPAAAAAAAAAVATASATTSAALAEEAATAAGEALDLPPENKDEGQECRTSSSRRTDYREGGARRLDENQRGCQKEDEEEDCCSSRIQGEARKGGQGAGERDAGTVRVASSDQTDRPPRSRAEGTWDEKPVPQAENGAGGEETPDGTKGTAEALTSTNAQRRKGGRRKRGGGQQGGGGEQRTRVGVLAGAAVDEMPGDLSRKQERSRNGRRRQAPMM